MVGERVADRRTGHGERHLLVAGTGVPEANGRHGDRLSPDSGDLRSAVSWRTSNMAAPSAGARRSQTLPLVPDRQAMAAGAAGRSRPAPSRLANHRVPVMTNHAPGGK